MKTVSNEYCLHRALTLGLMILCATDPEVLTAFDRSSGVNASD